MLRGKTLITAIGSAKEMWLIMISAGPSRGTFSSPSTGPCLASRVKPMFLIKKRKNQRRLSRRAWLYSLLAYFLSCWVSSMMWLCSLCESFVGTILLPGGLFLTLVDQRQGALQYFVSLQPVGTQDDRVLRRAQGGDGAR